MPRGGAKPAASSKANPFDSDSDSESQPAKKPSSGAYQAPADAKRRYKDGFRDAGGLESQSVEELEHYAAYKAEETTDALAGCLRIAEDIKQDATDTLITLHKQGEQISRTHEKAVEIDQDLTKVIAIRCVRESSCRPAANAVSLMIVLFLFLFLLGRRARLFSGALEGSSPSHGSLRRRGRSRDLPRCLEVLIYCVILH